MDWIRETEAQRLAAERELAVPEEEAPLSDQVGALVKLVRKTLVGLAKAAPAQKAGHVRHHGTQADPDHDTLEIEARPGICTQVRVGGGTVTINPPPIWITEVAA